MTRTDGQAASVLLVDDHPLIRKGLRTLLEGAAGVFVSGEAADGEQAIEQARSLAPDVIVMDISMPRLNGIEATRRILKDLPDTRIIALSIHSEQRFVDEMLHAGAAGYLLKDSVPEELVRAIQAVLRGEAFLSTGITGTLIDAYTQREADKVSGATVEAPAVDDALDNLLQTKLQLPVSPGDLVPRSDLHARLDRGRERPLTLVSAPAGYGKSMLISSWFEQSDWASAWFSLDRNDNSLRQFLAYFISAIRGVFPQACTGTLDLIKALELPSMSNLASTLVNELNVLDKPVLLALDDYHLIDAGSPVNQLMQWMLGHPPIPLHLVIITRRDPPLSLVSLRASAQVNEIRTLDLKFGNNEARTLLEQDLGRTVKETSLANLQKEMEGWVVGLRLVSLVLQQSNDPDEFLMGLHGGIQETQDYLVLEVIKKLPTVLREWLLKSSILDRFSAPLCDAVCSVSGGIESTGYDGSKFIKVLNDGNLFAIKLDPHGEWFRYHHLFQALLKRELSRQLTPDQVAELHLQASNWFETRGMIDEAIQHALESGEDNRAAEIIERHWRTEINKDRWYTSRKWLDMLPFGQRQHRPGLMLAELWQSICQQQFNKLPRLLKELESSIEDEATDPQIIRDLNFCHGLIEYWQGNSRNSLDYLEHSITDISDQPGVIDGWITLYYGLALCMDEKPTMARKTINDRIHGIGVSAHYHSQLVGALIFIHLLSGELTAARSQAQRLALLSHKSHITNTESWTDYLLGAIDLHRLELEQAAQHFKRAIRQRYILEPKAVLESLAGLALTQTLSGKSDEAVEALDQLLLFARERNDSESLLVADSCSARLQLLQGELAPAARWARTVSISPAPDKLFSWLEVPSITRARVVLAIGSEEALEEAAAQLALVRQLSDNCHYICQTIEIAVLQSLLLDKQGRSEEALEALADVVALAEPGLWVRPFIEAGQPMAELLGRLAVQQGKSNFLNHLGDCFQVRQTQLAAEAGGPRTSKSAARLEIEPLTNRELEILDLLVNRLQNKEIAARLFVSPETVKTHLKHLYQKLDVSNRHEAAEKARKFLNPPA
jgi:LuxR family maltose regulon positive regulatory protein